MSRRPVRPITEDLLNFRMSNYDDELSDIEALSARACALASVPVPDYHDAIERENSRSRRKYGNRFILDDDDDDVDEEDGVGGGNGSDEARSSMLLAERTSQILNSFQDYVSGIGVDGNDKTGALDNTRVKQDVLSSEGENMAAVMASNVRDGNKDGLFQRSNSRGSGHRDMSFAADNHSMPQLQRDWSYSDNQDTKSNKTSIYPYSEHMEEDEAMMRLARGEKYKYNLCRPSKRVKFGLMNCMLMAALILGVSVHFSHENKKNAEKMEEEVDELMNEFASQKNSPSTIQDPPPPPEFNVQPEKGEVELVNEIASNMNSPATIQDTPPPEFNIQPEKGEVELVDELASNVDENMTPEEQFNQMASQFNSTSANQELPPINEEIMTPEEQPNEIAASVNSTASNQDLPPPDESSLEVTTITNMTIESTPGEIPFSDANMNNTMKLFDEDIVEYMPNMFDRTQGWSGKTYLDAFNYCKNLASADGEIGNYGICSYEAVCPIGPNSFPIFGYHSTPVGRSWIPISGGVTNDWVNIDPHDSCVRYSTQNEYPPEWGINGGEADDLTTYLMCCLSADYLKHVDRSKITVDEAEGEFTGWNVVETLGVDHPSIHTYQELSAQFLPLEFDRSRGYKGQTFLDAFSLCGRVPGSLYQLCPYAVLCPFGPDTDPIIGTKHDITGSWMPIMGGNDAEWVQVGKDNLCVKWSAINSDPIPSWSITGLGNEEITRHVLCCLKTNNLE